MTGLIYAAIVVAWAAYLVPLALRRHDEAMRARSVDRFSSAMRVLARRSAGAQAPAPILAPRPNAGEVPVRAPAAPLSPAAARLAAARRRRVLLILLTATALVGGIVVAGLVPWWSLAAPVVLVLGFLVACRRQVQANVDASWAEAVARLPEASRRGARVDATYTKSIGDEPNDEPTVVLRAAASADLAPEPPQQMVAVNVPTAEGGSLWDPLPIMLPTYVTKPVAPRTIRTVSLDHPAGAKPEAVKPQLPDVQPAEIDAAEVQLEPRRAVGT